MQNYAYLDGTASPILSGLNDNPLPRETLKKMALTPLRPVAADDHRLESIRELGAELRAKGGGK